MQDPIKSALSHIRDLSDGPPVPKGLAVTLNFHPDIVVRGETVIKRMAHEGLYRSQFETGVSNGSLTAYPGGERWDWESRMFGGAYSVADALLRPKYGALNHRADLVGGSPRFGSCHLRLAPHVLARTTFCYPDSHLLPRHFGVADRMSLITLAEQNPSGLEVLDDYIEAQVHGPLNIAADVEFVVLDPSYQGSLVETAARALPCALAWHTGFSLVDLQAVDCERYRGPAAAQAVAALAKTGPVTPRRIGEARAAGLEAQLAKWVWHCVARFGRVRGL